MNKKFLRSALIAGSILVAFSIALVVTQRDRFKAEWGESRIIRILNNIEWLWYDIRFQSKGQEYAKNLLVAKIDDKSLARFGRWPWNRGLYAHLIDSTYAMGAEVVGFDAVFSEPEYNKTAIMSSIQAGVTQESKSLRDELALNQQQLDGLADNLPMIGDRVFAEGLKRNPRTVLGYIWQGARDCSIYDPESKLGKEISATTLTMEQAQQRGFVHVDTLTDNLTNLIDQADVLTDTPKPEKYSFEIYPCPVANRGTLAKAATYQGYFNAISDADGIFRRVPLVIGLALDKIPESAAGFLPEEWKKNPTFFPSLSLQILLSYFNPKAAAAHKPPRAKVKTRINGNNELEIVSIGIPREGADDLVLKTQFDGSILVNFFGTQSGAKPSIGEFSLAEVPFAEDKIQVPPAEFALSEYRELYGMKSETQNPLKDKAVIVGPTALGVYDLRPNPVQGDAPGVFLHASLVGRVIDFAKTGKENISIELLSTTWSLLILWVLGITLAYFLYSSTALQGATATLGVLAILCVIDFILFMKFHIAMSFMTTVIGVGTTALSLLSYKYFTEERERAFVKGAFAKFVSPELIKQIEKDPSKLRLGGEKKELTVMFSDIRGFTKLSERMKADELARFMNSYLSPMTDIIQENKGTIDKYMGDAIMAIFGAPVEYANHAEKSVDAALGMMNQLEELRVGWREQKLPSIDIGIGMNTGDMSVGNMGSSRIMAYTVMGDSVNLGSRLEGINKEYHTHIIISEFTRAKLGPDYKVRELDRVKVKGKNEPVTIFEVVGKGAIAPQKEQIIKSFEEALHLYYEKKFEEAKKLFQSLSSVDETSEVYVGRCELWMANPPPEAWDGSWTMQTK